MFTSREKSSISRTEVENCNRSYEQRSWPLPMRRPGLALLYLVECISSPGRKSNWVDIISDKKMIIRKLKKSTTTSVPVNSSNCPGQWTACNLPCQCFFSLYKFCEIKQHHQWWNIQDFHFKNIVFGSAQALFNSPDETALYLPLSLTDYLQDIYFLTSKETLPRTIFDHFGQL